jgi:ABC-type transporter Mla MlaB component
MPFVIGITEEGLLLQLSGSVTVRNAQELGKSLAESLASGATATVQAAAVDDIDTSALQILVSLRKTAAAFTVQEPSEPFVNAVDRCALRREVLGGPREESL